MGIYENMLDWTCIEYAKYELITNTIQFANLIQFIYYSPYIIVILFYKYIGWKFHYTMTSLV